MVTGVLVLLNHWASTETCIHAPPLICDWTILFFFFMDLTVNSFVGWESDLLGLLYFLLIYILNFSGTYRRPAVMLNSLRLTYIPPFSFIPCSCFCLCFPDHAQKNPSAGRIHTVWTASVFRSERAFQVVPRRRFSVSSDWTCSLLLRRWSSYWNVPNYCLA